VGSYVCPQSTSGGILATYISCHHEGFWSRSFVGQMPNQSGTSTEYFYNIIHCNVVGIYSF